MNLLSNAEKFTTEGEVILKVILKNEGAEKEEVLFEVIDTGEGIDAGQLDSIFEQYVQSEWTMRANRKGTGLGLTISRRLVDLLGGHLSVKSVLEEGSNFFFSIPLRKDEIKEVSVNVESSRVGDHDISFEHPITSD